MTEILPYTEHTIKITAIAAFPFVSVAQMGMKIPHNKTHTIPGTCAETFLQRGQREFGFSTHK